MKTVATRQAEPAASVQNRGVSLARLMTILLAAWIGFDVLARFGPLDWLNTLPQLQAARWSGRNYPFRPNYSGTHDPWVGETALTGTGRKLPQMAWPPDTLIRCAVTRIGPTSSATCGQGSGDMCVLGVASRFRSHYVPVSGFRSSHAFSASAGAKFGIKGHQQTFDSGVVWFGHSLKGVAARTERMSEPPHQSSNHPSLVAPCRPEHRVDLDMPRNWPRP